MVGASALPWSESCAWGGRSCGSVRALGVQRVRPIYWGATERCCSQSGGKPSLALLSSRCAALLDAFVWPNCYVLLLPSLLLQLRSRAGFVARRHGGACDRSPQDENKQASARRTGKTRLRICKTKHSLPNHRHSQPPQPIGAAHATTGLAQSAAPTFGSRSAPPRGHRTRNWAAGLVPSALTRKDAHRKG